MPVLNRVLGPSSYELTGWFLLYGAAATAYTVNLQQPNGLIDTVGWGLFGPYPLTAFAYVCGLLAYQGFTADPVNWHGAALAAPAILALIIVRHADLPEGAFEEEWEATERRRLERGNPDPLSTVPDPRLEPIPWDERSRSIVTDFAERPFATIAYLLHAVCVLAAGIGAYIILYASIFER